jgi:type I restriction enzyme, S subunit
MIKKSYLIKDIGADFGDAPFGSSLKSRDYTSKGIPIIQGQNIVDQVFEWNRKLYTSEEKFKSLKRSHCKAGDLVFPKIGNRTVGSCAIAPVIEGYTTYLLSTNMMKMSVNWEIADIKYVYYFFCQPSIRQKIISQAGGGAQPIFNFTSLKNFKIELPPVPVQHKIADILSVYDDLIEVNTRRIRVLEQLARSMYREWFGKMNVLTEGWQLCKIGELINFAKGKKPKTTKPVGEIPLLLIDSLRTGASEFADEPGMVIAEPDDIIMVMDGASSGKIFTGYYGAVGSTLGRYRPKDRLKFSHYHFYFFVTENFNQISDNNIGAAIPHANKDFINQLDVAIPSKEIESEFHEQMVPVFDLIRVLQKKNINLRQMRDLLLPRLISKDMAIVLET